jgi:hypothetical protein
MQFQLQAQAENSASAFSEGVAKTDSRASAGYRGNRPNRPFFIYIHSTIVQYVSVLFIPEKSPNWSIKK